ncbi:MAG TPA: hypothetical protein VJ938_03140 [Acidimicrobiia bacterium]|nr:hypothetical protein [Acidimicrobiia bacterium]
MIHSQIITAEPWTPASVLAGLALVAVIAGIVVWRILHSDD